MPKRNIAYPKVKFDHTEKHNKYFNTTNREHSAPHP